MNSPKRKRRIRAFDMMLFGARTLEATCLDRGGTRVPILPRYNPKTDEKIGSLRIDHETQEIVVTNYRTGQVARYPLV